MRALLLTRRSSSFSVSSTTLVIFFRMVLASSGVGSAPYKVDTIMSASVRLYPKWWDCI